MIFSELYSVYYNTVARILKKALEPQSTETELREQVSHYAFSESVMSILPSLKSGKWQLMHEDLSPVIQRAPTMPLTLLEKRWLKSLADDPRLRLFGIELPELHDTEPLFDRSDYRIYDRYSDGDPFEDEKYIEHFRMIRQAIREKRPVMLRLENRHGRPFSARFYPVGLEYSVKDDKIRILAEKSRYRQYSLARVKSCEFYTGRGSWSEECEGELKKELLLEIRDERNALERVMLHFAHFEKRAERVGEKIYRLRLSYYESDETEMVIRILSFGPYLRVIEPQDFVLLIKNRLISQKICGPS